MILHWLHNMELFLRSFDFINFIICKLRRFHKREPRARASTTTFDLWTPDPTFKKCCCCGLLPLWWRCLDTLARVHSQLVKPVRNQTWIVPYASNPSSEALLLGCLNHWGTLRLCNFDARIDLLFMVLSQVKHLSIFFFYVLKSSRLNTSYHVLILYLSLRRCDDHLLHQRVARSYRLLPAIDQTTAEMTDAQGIKFAVAKRKIKNLS